jgi:hypothetical protein
LISIIQMEKRRDRDMRIPVAVKPSCSAQACDSLLNKVRAEIVV